MMVKREILDPKVMERVTFIITNATINHPNIQKLIKDPTVKFDAVIAEWMFSDLYSGFGPALDCPLIWSSSIEPHSLVVSLIHEHLNPAYTSDSMSSIEPPYSFVERVKSLMRLFMIEGFLWTKKSANEKAYIEAFASAAEKRGKALPPLDVVKYNASLMFGNSHFSFGQSISLPQNYVHIAGYHTEETVQPLPQDLQKIMDDSKNGVIYFSMGSMLKSKTFPDDMKRELLDMFGALKQTVIWKFEEVMPNLPKNVHILTWAPQQSILAHPNCILFITHGGLLSTTEALHFGVPIIGIPMFADQFINVQRAVNRGFAKEVQLTPNLVPDLKAEIVEICSNSKYGSRIKELSVIYHDRPLSPGKSLVYWTEYVIRTKGAPHLRSPALFNTWYEKMYLDLLALIVITLLILTVVVKKVLGSEKKQVKIKQN